MFPAKLVRLDTMPNTKQGNPVYRAHLELDTGDILAFNTKPDSAFANVITGCLNNGTYNWHLVNGLIINAVKE